MGFTASGLLGGGADLSVCFYPVAFPMEKPCLVVDVPAITRVMEEIHARMQALIDALS